MDSAPQDKFQIQFRTSLQDVSASDWNRLTDADHPFLDYEFLATLENTGCIGKNTSWLPYYLLCFDKDHLIGAIPSYIRLDSDGEFIFDYAWADFYNRTGRNYYPKGVVAAPFTPATGQRLLVAPDYEFELIATLMIQALINDTQKKGLSSIHILFPTKKEHDLLVRLGFLSRVTYQFHWENKSYTQFDDYLAALHSQKRKNIKKERRLISELPLTILTVTGDEITQEHIDAMWAFYHHTHSRKWGRPYLNKAWFDEVFITMKHALVLILAHNGNEWVGGSFNFYKNQHLYGRYWGCNQFIPNLHFECCFYQLIEFAIKHNITLFEAGAQGEQKFLRGFNAAPTYSAHWFFDPAARDAIEGYLEQERAAIKDTITAYNDLSPLKK